jgi:hypothetical protein
VGSRKKGMAIGGRNQSAFEVSLGAVSSIDQMDLMEKDPTPEAPREVEKVGEDSGKQERLLCQHDI